MLDPLKTTTQIHDAFVGYLRSTFGPRRNDLRREFHRALDESGQLTRGPFVQATAPFEPGRSINELIEACVITNSFSQLKSSFPLDRPLHKHQDQAVVRSVEHNRNLVVSTGTGSGKTETFLVPIIDSLLREQAAGTLATPGVRALLLYPMNALANDQVKRLRELLAPVPDITFGRYTGETKGSQSDAEDDFRQRHPGVELHPNELISREVMQASPPHILLTNYAMLEYLLLRPEDTPFFDGKFSNSWRFLVLDEAHVYNGAQGTEVAYLIRRLRDRINGSEQGKLRCFATSATLGSDESDNPEIVRFAEDLFGEPFEWDPLDPARQDVITATRLPMTSSAEVAGKLSPDQVRALHEQFRSDADPARILEASGVACSVEPEADVSATLHQVLSRDASVIKMQSSLEDHSEELRDLAMQLFPDETDRESLTVQLIDLCVNARLGPEDSPLLPARYHYFVRSLEGAFACLHPDHSDSTPRVSFQRTTGCQGCDSDGRSSTLFELATCRHCRAEYVLGVPDKDGVLKRANEFDTHRRYFLLGEAVDADDEDQSTTNIAAETTESGLEICAACGSLCDAGSACQCGRSDARIAVTGVEPGKGSRGAVQRCASCSGRSNGEVLFRFLTGTDAPVSVIATALYQNLPKSADEDAADQVGEGRKLLTFSDSRQDAAFFAGYLERTYGRSLHRSLILDAVSTSTDPLRTNDLIDAVLKSAEQHLVLDSDNGRVTNRKIVASWVHEELLAMDRRQSLEGTGLMRISLATPRKYRPPPPLLALGLSPDEADSLVQLLLGSLRSGGAVTTPDGVDIRDEQFAPRNREFAVRGTGSEFGVLAWNPAAGSLNRRLDILQKLYERLGLDGDPKELLDSLWKYLTDPNGPWAATLLQSSSRRQGAIWKLDVDRFEFESLSDERRPLRCDRCSQLTWRDVSRVCPAWRCHGTLQPVDNPAELTGEHYARLYQQLKPISLNAQEHTAQWTAIEASSIQDKFIGGDVNVLSCSTTFEMGVDVGDLQAVLLRNVPPGVANYVQRAGRAGRRADTAALVVTYSQRRNHDRYYYERPLRMVDGHVPTPSILLGNVHIARRHSHSVAFAQYLRILADHNDTTAQTVGDYFSPTQTDQPVPSDEFEDWLRSQSTDLHDALARILPPEVAADLEIDDWGWVDALLEESDADPTHGWYRRAKHDVRQELMTVEELRQDALEIEDPRALGRAKNLERTIRSQQLIGFLSSQNVLPKYGFPVDVVGLNLRGSGHSMAGRVDLTRDLTLAISDYAPGSQVVAGKILWTSTGLEVRHEHAWPTYGWAVCNDCGAFRRALAERPPTCHICGSSQVKAGTGGKFVIPIFGFVGRDSKAAGEARPLKNAFAEPYFSSDDGVPFEQVAGLRGGVAVASRMSRQGRIAMINKGGGAGYQICEWCGAGVPAPRNGRPSRTKTHDSQRNPGRQCSGPRLNVQLGHEYLTDVVELKIDTDFDTETAYGVLYALIESSRDLGIRREELDGTLFVFAQDQSSGIVLFDSVPGGAGHCQRIVKRLPELIDYAYRRVDSCTCGRDSSCYSCLRSYSNQRMHEQLNRGETAAVLARLLG
ncbi:MAG TPA: DEAD/DEAH box helicase [Microthrixaceae bacterium]|nr:DEAD/DEAH box helicase [Microthrixaceae bacterium]